MARLVCVLATVLLAGSFQEGRIRTEEGPYTQAEVVAQHTDVFDRPDRTAVTTNRIGKGRQLSVFSVQDPSLGDEWLAIRPPPGSFSWINLESIETISPGKARVKARSTVTRPGGANAVWPGLAQHVVELNSVVRLIDRPRIELIQKGAKNVWVAIEPPEDEVRYIPRNSVRLQGPIAFARSQRLDEPSIEDQGAASSENAGAPNANRVVQTSAPLPAGFAAKLSAVDARRKTQERLSIEQWRLEPILAEYRSLLDQAADASSASLVRSRIRQTQREIELSNSARSFDDQLANSRQRNQQVESIIRTAEKSSVGKPTKYSAEGVLQPTSRMVDGQKAYALIARDGTVAAYLTLPPGLSPNALVAASRRGDWSRPLRRRSAMQAHRCSRNRARRVSLACLAYPTSSMSYEHGAMAASI